MGKGQTAADSIVIEDRSVDDPMMTDAELIHRRSTARAENKLVGKIGVTGNAMTRIGALCYVRRRLGHHERAAERFKSLYEGLYGSGMPAVDAGRVQVDTSIIAHDSGVAARIDRGADLRGVRVGLGKRGYDLLVAAIVLGITCEEMVSTLPSGEPNRRHVVKCVDRLLAHLDWLATSWGYTTDAA